VKLNLTASYTAQTSVILCVPSDFLFYLSLLTDAIRYSAPLRSLTRVPLPLPSPRFQLAPPPPWATARPPRTARRRPTPMPSIKRLRTTAKNSEKNARSCCWVRWHSILGFHVQLRCWHPCGHRSRIIWAGVSCQQCSDQPLASPCAVVQAKCTGARLPNLFNHRA
jgi:hypothetical protein